MFKLRFADRAKFFIERQFVKGAAYQLLVVVFVIALISIVGGLLVLSSAGPGEDVADSVWWAFLRLTDPGYLGDDEGTWRRIVSTWLTVSGYVIFLGALVAIMTRWLIALMTRLEKGLTPVSLKNHIVILGWGNRTVPVLRELLKSVSRMGRFLRDNKAKRLQVVVLDDEISAVQLHLLRQDPAIGRRSKAVILRSGNVLQPEALHRAACLNAAAIIVPGQSVPGSNLISTDVEIIKALLSLSTQARELGHPLPYVVAEIEDVRKVAVAQRAYPGPLEVVAGDATISRLIAQNIIHPGLSELYDELLTGHKGNELYVRSADAWAGRTLAEVAADFPTAIVCGLLRRQEDGWRAWLNRASSMLLKAGDRVVVMAPSYEATEPRQGNMKSLPQIERPENVARSEGLGITGKRLLILGWNRRVPALIAELASYSHYEFDVDLVSVVASAVRQNAVHRYSPENAGVICRHIEADYMVQGELRRLNPAEYDSVVLLCSDQVSSGEEADARALVGFLVLDELLAAESNRPQILLELSDPANESLVVRKHSETIISPVILSHMLSQITLRRELRVLYDELFTARGAEMWFRAQSDYAIEGPLTFRQLEILAAEHGDTGLGIYRAVPDAAGRRLWLNPPRDQELALQPGDELVVLTTT